MLVTIHTPAVHPSTHLNPGIQCSSSEMTTSNQELDWTPSINMEFNTLADVEKHWSNYGKQMGFSIRKGFKNTSQKDGIITSRGFLCSKGGLRIEDKRRVESNHRDETRTDCHARLFVSLVRNSGKYKVYDFLREHNHDLHVPDTLFMMKNQRSISQAQGLEIDLARSAGLTLKKSYDFMVEQAGGRENLGYIHSDQKTHLRLMREKLLKGGDASTIYKYFEEQQSKRPAFHYVIQQDDEQQITSIFWADARMIVDYVYFGDVITFDTTFGTNKELRPLAVFTGFNNHKGIVVFGAALLYDETVESFEWLFKCFLNAHNGKSPRTIFTDQDAVMANALGATMSKTYHGLCNWHIVQNAIKHLGKLMRDHEGSSFLREFKRCMFQYETELEFEEAWAQLIGPNTYEDVSWLHGIYKLRKKWARCHLKKEFTLGVKSTQLAESLNADLKDYLKSDLNILDLFQQFERVVQQKRYRELELDFNARDKLPLLSLKRSPILQQAAKIYTPTLFKKFQDEIDRVSAATVLHSDEENLPQQYLIEVFEEAGRYIVDYTPETKTILCSCRMFETFGILCCHALKVFDRLDIKSIPDAYIVKRWTREAKSGYIPEKVDIKEGDISLQISQRYKQLCPRLVRLASRVSENEEAFTLVQQFVEDIEKKVDNILALKVNESVGNSNKTFPILFHDNGLVQKARSLKPKTGSKGRKRHKSFIEQQQKRKTPKTGSKSVGKQANGSKFDKVCI